MPFSAIWPLLEQKALRKGRTAAEVITVTQWLTGYGEEDIHRMLEDGTAYGDFFRNAPR